MVSVTPFVAALLLPLFAQSAESNADNALGANPIRKVVNLLEAMKKKITVEGEKETELMKKFNCYCSTNGETLKASIADANAKAPAISSEITEKESEKAQLDEDLKSHQADRSAAKDAIAQATSIREKEAAAFAKEKADYNSNIEALTKAITAITRGMAGGFLQTNAAQLLRKLISSQDMNDPDRQELMAFLSSADRSDSSYVPKSGEITGILEQIKEDMEKALAEASDVESASISSYAELTSAKAKEVEALTQSIEAKSQRVGALAVEIVTAKNDLTDTQRALMEDTKFLADLEQNCDTKKGEWEDRSKTRADELLAISEAIKVLNDDDALDLFKKALPSAASASLVQVGSSAAMLRTKTFAALNRGGFPRRGLGVGSVGRLDLDFIGLAIHGKKIGFEKVLKMIDSMVEALKAEQVEDDSKKEYCTLQFDKTDDKKKSLERTKSDQETAIDEATSGIAALQDELKALSAGLDALDKSVAEASMQRKTEHSEFQELISTNSAAKDVMNMAIKRLNQFYNPSLPAASLFQVSAALQGKTVRDAPAPPPETFGEYETKTGESAGVISMLKTLIKDLDKEITVAETFEENAQKDYEQIMKDAGEKKSLDLKAVTSKKASLAALESEFETHKDELASTSKTLVATGEYLQTLHSECDWLQQYYDVRKEARASEMDSLKNAKAVLNGADFSLLQRPRSFLQQRRSKHQ